MAWERKVKRHVAVMVKKTVGGNANYVKRRPAVITALGAGALITCRVKHGTETYVNVDRRTNPVTQTVAAASLYVSY